MEIWEIRFGRFLRAGWNNKQKCPLYFSNGSHTRWYLRAGACIRAASKFNLNYSMKITHYRRGSEELCNRRSDRNSATQHAHKFIFYQRMHYASFRHILAVVFALLHFTRIKMNRRVLLCNVFLIVHVIDSFCKRLPYSRTFPYRCTAFFSLSPPSPCRIYRILFTVLRVLSSLWIA